MKLLAPLPKNDFPLGQAIIEGVRPGVKDIPFLQMLLNGYGFPS
jgi:hypothetical protein